MKAVRVHEVGGPEVLRHEDVADPKPAAGQALVRIEAIGVNFIDTYFRTGLYDLALPFIAGVEAAGTVVEAAPDVTEVKAGDRVGCVRVPGCYAEYVAAPAAQLVKLPEGLSAQRAAAAIIQGITAHYLAISTYALKPGDVALVHAAAGGTGLLLVQVAKMRGARVIGTVSTEEKAKLAREAGADDVILYTREDFEAAAKKLTDGRGVNVVYDAVGKTTWEKSLNSLARRGMLVLYGQASGRVPPIDPLQLSAKRSLYVTRPNLSDYIVTREELLWRAGEVFRWIVDGKLKLRIDRTLPLSAAAEAHRLLESRQTTGKILLLP